MYPQCSLADLIGSVGRTYRAMNIRVVAVREGDSWINFMTVVRLTYEEPNDIEKRLREKEELLTPEFQIFLRCRPFSAWDTFCREVSSGIIALDDRQFSLQKGIDLLSTQETLRQLDSDIRVCDTAPWSAFYVKNGAHEARMLMDGKFARAVSPFGYANAYEAINDFCDVNVEFGSRAGYDFCLYAPVFARVSTCRIVPSDGELVAEVESHPNLGDISTTAVIRDRNSNTGAPPKARIRITDFTSAKTDEPLEVSTGKAQIPDNVSLDDVLEIRLNLPQLGQIYQWANVIRQIVPPSDRNILFEALKCFCPEAELKRLLEQAMLIKAHKLKGSAAFEMHVGWLLGLFGLSTIVLGEYEHLVVPGASVRLGSLDILAAHQKSKLLLLVGCSFAAPTEQDFANLVGIRERLVREVFANTGVRIIPVFFSAAVGCLPYREDASVGFIPVIDADRTALFLELLEQGGEPRFFDFIANPQYGE